MLAKHGGHEQGMMSPGGDTAAALADKAFYMIQYILTQHRATMQRPWHSLHSVSARVFV